ITTILTTQYLEEADVLSDNIIVIDKGTIVAEGTADDLKARTGTSYCEVVPLHPHDIPRVLEALSDLLPPESRPPAENGPTAVSVPAPKGAQTLAEVLRRLDLASIELNDIALRRPSLD